jgi:hypothetical protein
MLLNIAGWLPAPATGLNDDDEIDWQSAGKGPTTQGFGSSSVIREPAFRFSLRVPC